jgi:hypothetical protein
MRRPFVIQTGALALALLPAALYAQTPAQPAQPTAQPPTAQTPAAQTPAQPETPAKPALSFTSNAGLLLVQVKPDQTAVFEEMMSKLKAAFASTQDAALKAQGAGIKVYKAAEGMQSNALYVIVADPATPDAEYYPLQLLAKMMTDDEKRNPETQALFKKYNDVFAGVNKLNLTIVGGGM